MKRAIDPDAETTIGDMNPEELIVLALAHAEEARRILNQDAWVEPSYYENFLSAARAHAAVSGAYAGVVSLIRSATPPAGA